MVIVIAELKCERLPVGQPLFYIHDQLFALSCIKSIFVSLLLKKEAVTALPHVRIARKYRFRAKGLGA
jgi:hypothetical protein